MKEYILLRQGIVTNPRGDLTSIWSLEYFKDSHFQIWHRENDLPAIIYNYGTKLYFQNRKCVKVCSSVGKEWIYAIL
jgi:hypothetical protein